LSRILTLPLDQDVEQGMIRLPNRIRSLCLTPVNQIKICAVGLLPFMRQSQEPRGYLSHDFIDHVIAWNYAARFPNKFKINFEDGSSATLCLADPGSSVAVRDKNNAVEYLG